MKFFVGLYNFIQIANSSWTLNLKFSSELRFMPIFEFLLVSTNLVISFVVLPSSIPGSDISRIQRQIGINHQGGL